MQLGAISVTRVLPSSVMNKSLPDQLQRVLKTHSLPCGAIIDATGKVVSRAGDFDKFASVGLVSALLGPYGDAKATFDHIHSSELKPVIWGQGDEFAFADTSGELTVVVFGRNRGDVLARAKLSRLVGATIAAEFTGHDA